MILVAESVPDLPVLAKKNSPCPSGLSRSPCPMGVPFFNRLTANILACSSLDNTCYLSCLHQPHLGSTHTDGLASRLYGVVIKASRTKKWQPGVPMQLLAAACTRDEPPQDTGWALGCSTQEGMAGGRSTRHRLAATVSVQWSHWGSKMQTCAGTVGRLFGTEGAKSLSVALP